MTTDRLDTDKPDVSAHFLELYEEETPGIFVRREIPDRDIELYADVYESEDDDCRRCHKTILLRDGYESTGICDTCCQEIVADLAVASFPASTCVECGKKIPPGQVQRCKDGDFCYWRIPAAVEAWIRKLKNPCLQENL